MQKRLYRSRKEKKLAGVCGGIAEYFDVDPVWVRIAFVLITVMHGAGILVYVACLVLIPLEPFEFVPAEKPADDGSEAEKKADETGHVVSPKDANRIGGRNVFGGILVVLGVLLLLENLIASFDFDEVFPMIMIIFGIWLLMNPFKKGQTHEL
ncbi:MAG: PspC domain-containing protein [Ignavibacteriales bacterium]|nr:PspC domain-containing protein [Ignavibacteriales bacterium]